jgi:hypothetical protein
LIKTFEDGQVIISLVMPSPFWRARDFKFQIKETASKIVCTMVFLFSKNIQRKHKGSVKNYTPNAFVRH